MEKNEKIRLRKARTVRVLLASLCVIGCVVLLWSLLSMEDGVAIVAPIGSHQQQQLEQQQQQQLRKNPMLPPIFERETQQQQQEAEKAKAETTAAQDAEKLLVERVQMLDKEVRQIKANLPNGSFMETDEKGVAASQRLQDATRLLLATRYGEREPYRVKVSLKFQPSNPTLATMGEFDSFVLELAPSQLQPHSIFTFLEVARHWPEQKGAFHRRAGHVLQVLVRGNQVPHLAFQEYSPDYPHVKGTVGYAGRPSGPAWYVSIQDNSRNHGPGSQQDANPHEADSCFGKVVEGFETVVLNRITKMPGSEFLPAPNHVLIEAMTILVPNPEKDGEYQEWQPTSRITEFQK